MNDASGGRLQVGEAVARGLPLVRHAKVRRQESLDLGGRPGLLARCVGLRLPGHRRALEVRGREGDLVQTHGQLCGQLQGCAVRLGAGLEDARLAHAVKVLRRNHQVSGQQGCGWDSSVGRCLGVGGCLGGCVGCRGGPIEPNAC